MRLSSPGFGQQAQEGERRCLNSELWHACAGPLVSLPAVGSRVVYFPQGHSEQVAASTNKEVDSHIPNYPNLPPQLICQLHNVTMHADVETDEVYAQMTLQPLSAQEQKDTYLPSDLGTPSKQPTNYFCKTLTASDTSTHGGFSVPRRAAEKVFPPLDFTQQPPAQELIARDLHDNEWKFRHIFRGQPKRHLLTTGWSVFVSAKRLVAGDSVLFIWNEKGQLLLGIRRANRPQTVMPSSVLSSDSMHIGLLAAAAHAAATNSRFTIFYNPRASPSEFVIPLAKYAKAVYHTRVSIGMRFRMLFETEESSVRRYMGTITGMGDLDPVRWLNSHWRSVKVGWDESTAGERQPRVSLWEIEPLATFPMYPSPYPLRLKRPWPQGIASLHGIKEDDGSMNTPFMWMRGDNGERTLQALNFPGMSVNPWMQQRFDSSVLGMQPDVYQAMAAAALQEMRSVDPSKQLLQFQQQQQQPQQFQCRSNPQLQRQIFQHQQQTQPHILQQQAQNLQEQLPQSHLLQQQLQQSSSPHQIFQHKLQHSFGEEQQSLSEQQQCQQSFQIPNVGGALSQLPSSQTQSPLSLPSSMCSPSVFTDASGNFSSAVTTSSMSPLQNILSSLSAEESSHYLNLPRTTHPVVQQPARTLTPGISRECQISPTSWVQKRLSNNLASCLSGGQVEAPLLSGVTQTESLGQSHIPTSSISLPHFPSRDCPPEQEGLQPDSQSHLLFGVNIDSPSLIVPSTLANLRNVGNGTDVTMPFNVSNFFNAPPCASGSDFPLNSNIGVSACLDDNGLLSSAEDLGQLNPPTRTFIKVYKQGSVGRSLDVTRFSSYPELRSELAHMFGLEGQLEDPLRSGWQLVFIDKENDALLPSSNMLQAILTAIAFASPRVKRSDNDFPLYIHTISVYFAFTPATLAYIPMARLRLLLLAAAIVCIFYCQLPANAQRAKALVTPITKDPKTLRYTIEIQQKTPLQKQILMLDLNRDYAQVRCGKNIYKSSTYAPVACPDSLCKSYAYSGCGTCYSPTAPGCHNETCVVPGIPSRELARDVAAIRVTDGLNPGTYVRAPGVVFACDEEDDPYRDFPSTATGVAGMSASALALPAQLAGSLGIRRKFAMCLPSSTTSPGALFFGSEPYVFLPPPGRDLSKGLVTTPLIKNKIYTDDYYIGLRGIRVGSVDVAFNKSALQIGPSGRGGSKLDTLVAYTQLSTAVYNSLVRVFAAQVKKMNVTRAAAVAPFDTCFNSKGVASTRVGPGVPAIDLVLQNNATWRIFGANSMVQVSDKVICLGFVDGGADPVTTVVIGTHQMENNFLQFDLATSTLGLSSSLLFQRTTCSNFNFTSSK